MPSNSLEQQAMERVRRMYSSFDRPSSKPEPERPARREQHERREEHKPHERHEEHEHHEHREHPPVEPPKRESRGLLEALMRDKDQSLIMLLLVILMKDGADMNLLLALLYILI